jgi:hypothetical protein
MQKPGWLLLFFAFGALAENLTAQTSTNSVPYSTPNLGGVVSETAGGDEAIVVGYGRVQPTVSTMPAGVAIIAYRANDMVVSEAGVPATATMTSGRTYAEVNGPVNTGLAMVNPNSVPAQVSFFFTDESGNDFRQDSFTLPANGQIGKFVDEAPFNAGRQFSGTLTFTTSAPIAVLALRGVTNSRNEFLISTQNVTALPDSFSATPVLLGHFAAGDGWTTRLILVNTTEVNQTGTVQFFGQGSGVIAAAPLTLSVNGRTASTFDYTIRARSSTTLSTASPATIFVGSIRITPAAGGRSPASFAVYSYTAAGVLQTEAAVPTQPAASAFRTYVEVVEAEDAEETEEDDEPEIIQSSLAITNNSAASATVNLELFRLNGTTTGLTALATVPPNGQISRFVHELFPAIDTPFRGILRITAGTSSIVLVSLRTRYNDRGDFLITSTPASIESASSTTAEMFFPHFADRGGYQTKFIFFSGTTGQTTNGNLRFFSQSGQPLSVSIR